MDRFRVRIKASAAKELQAVSGKRNRQRLVRKIKALETNPRPPGSQKLSGRERYRIRQGDFRIVYAIEKSELTVMVVKIGHRKGVYRSS